MAPRDDDWSDSDDEELPDVETSVLLGIPDGPIEKQEDIDDAAVSRLGGYPVRVISYLRYMYSYTHCNRSFIPFFFYGHCRLCYQDMNRHCQVRSAKIVHHRWNFWSSYGAPLKIAPWIVPCTFGDARDPRANERTGGESGC